MPNTAFVILAVFVVILCRFVFVYMCGKGNWGEKAAKVSFGVTFSLVD